MNIVLRKVLHNIIEKFTNTNTYGIIMCFAFLIVPLLEL
jgi:hypothetical protein